MDRDGSLASALQAAHAWIDRLGSDVAKAEERNTAERERLEGAWRIFHETVENCREAKKRAFLCRDEARREAREIREGALRESV